MTARRVALALSLPFALIVGYACGGDDVTAVQEVATVAVSPATASLSSFGATTQLSASARDASGTAVTGSGTTFTWGSSAAAVATVSATGLVTAVSNGTATVTATVVGGTASGTATITVAQEAAAISVTLPVDTITAGATAQATVAAEDAGGSVLANPAPTWSSSDADVASVDASGLVTGMSAGTVTITAAQNGASGDASLVVVRPDLMVDADTMLGGTVIVGDFTVGAEVTVTLSSDLRIEVGGAMVVEGAVMGDCLALSIDGPGSVEISGTVDNSCATQERGGADAPPLMIDADGGVDLTDAIIVSSGPVEISSEPPAAVLRSAGPRSASAPPALGTVNLEGATISPSPSEATPAPEGDDSAPNGSDFTFRAAVDVIFNGTTIRTQHGAPGRLVNVGGTGRFAGAGGGAGGRGGDVVVEVPGGGVLRFRTSRGATRFIPGNGAPGGPATAEATQNETFQKAPGATAIGGQGGRGGQVRLFGEATIIGDPTLLQWEVGSGGRGGNATAVAADGVDATTLRVAQPGGDAAAQAGMGGAAGTNQGGYLGMPQPEGKQGGGGGIARATAGNGGSGFSGNPDGADAGDAKAFGGAAGASTLAGGREGADAIAQGGNGGNGADVCATFSDVSLGGQISVASDPASSDQFIFNAGSGESLNLLFRVLQGPASTEGGKGGFGGELAADGGDGGFGRNIRAADGIASVGPGGNGGDGGDGNPAGRGGASGTAGVNSDPGAQTQNPLFRDGTDGGACAIKAAAAASAVDQTIQITGSAPWVTVNGTLSDDGTVTGTGRGTVAGRPNILVEFSGTWNAETQTLAGTYTIDSEKVIAPDHPVVYNVNVSGG